MVCMTTEAPEPKTLAVISALAREVTQSKGVTCRAWNSDGLVSIWVDRGNGLTPIVEDVTRSVAYRELQSALRWLPDAPAEDS